MARRLRIGGGVSTLREVGRRALQARVGSKWDAVSLQHRERNNWWHSRELKAYVNGRISPAGGVAGELAARLAGRRLGRGISIGCGSGGKELELVRAGLVERFELYELSEVRCALGREAAAAAGLGDRLTFHAADAFARPHAPCDLVYWDHALHHMLDVRKALDWSVAALAPGGLLVINDYVGPTRLQWTPAEVRLARAYMAAAAPHLAGARPVGYKIPLLSRWRMAVRDPSEAPQSDRILAAARAACGGFLAPIGCAMINICGPHVVPVTEEGSPALAMLIDWDRRAEAAGFAHFAFGIWQKP
jgi:SAM-dependent methyltransferase